MKLLSCHFRMLFALTSILFGCDADQRKNVAKEIYSSGAITCVNHGAGSTCFGGAYPQHWDTTTMPNASIIFHRPDNNVKLVGPFQICLDDGACFGDPVIGSLEAAEVVLQPIEASGSLAAHINIVCQQNQDETVKCWGHNWGPLRAFTSEQIASVSARFSEIAINSTTICGTTKDGVECSPLWTEPHEDSPQFKTFKGFEKTCMNDALLCARSRDSPSDIFCEFEPEEVGGTPKRVNFGGVVEYGCGSQVCLNRGGKVECHARDGGVKTFDVQIQKLSVGSYQFCGLSLDGDVICRSFDDKVEKLYDEYRGIELLSLESWRNLEGKSKRDAGGLRDEPK